MLFKEKLLLSNCDSVRQLNVDELNKRFLTGIAFADGVIMTPNTLIDNPQISEMISHWNVIKYLNEEGYGKFIVRGFGLNDEISLVDYFDALGGDFILSSFEGRPTKSQLTPYQIDQMKTRLAATQDVLNRIHPKVQGIDLDPNALKNEISSRISDDEIIGSFFDDDGERILFKTYSDGCISRSHWYSMADSYFGKKSPLEVARFKAEIIDPAYNSLFAEKGEGFLQDNIKIINKLPANLLNATVSIRAFKNEIDYVRNVADMFEVIFSLGTTELAKLVTDEALNFIQDKLQDKGEHYLTKKNWFGMYNVMTKKIGLEFK